MLYKFRGTLISAVTKVGDSTHPFQEHVVLVLGLHEICDSDILMPSALQGASVEIEIDFDPRKATHGRHTYELEEQDEL